jgi:translocator protein
LTLVSASPNPTPTSTLAKSRVRSFFALFIWILICFAASGVGAVAVNQTLDSWYVMLRKPSWNPPNWVFGPVWTALYTMMAVSAWLTWRRRLYTMMAVSAWLTWRRRLECPAGVRVALGWFAVQLVLNALWSWLFFAWRQPGWGFAEIIILSFAIAMTMGSEWRVSRPAALLMVPYLAWVTFASALNGAIWRLNS